MNDPYAPQAPPSPPYSLTFSQTIPELILRLQVTLAVSTYQAGKVLLISAEDADQLIQLPRNFHYPMGMAVTGGKMAVAAREEVTVLANAPGLAGLYPKKPGVYDGFFVPRASYYTGPVNIHELAWGNEGLWAVNTAFSCLCTIDDAYSFTPRWRPFFISELSPEDRCHLNGVAVRDGRPKYVTALARTDTREGWRPKKQTGGILMDVDTQDIILENLPMPHTPRLYDGRLLMLLSATGELIEVDVRKKKYEVLKALDGFARGMDRYGDYLFVGLSKLRKTSKAFGDLPIAERSVFCGVVVIYLPQMSIVGHIKYESSVEEIFDVKVLPGLRKPGILSTLSPDHRLALSLPDSTFWAVAAEASHNKKDD